MTAEIFRCLGIDPNRYIMAFEEKITPFMRENGMIDGKFLARTIKIWKPKIAQYLPIPDGDFRLVEIVDSLAGPENVGTYGAYKDLSSIYIKVKYSF